MLRGKKKVYAEFGLIFLVYNLKRISTIMGYKGLKMILKALKCNILELWRCVEIENGKIGNLKIKMTIDRF